MTITGLFPRIFFGGSLDEQKIVTIEQWGDNPWTSMNGAFENCINLQGNFSDSPDLTNVTDMSRMFTDASSFDHPIGNWDVSNATNMNALFFGASSFNQNIGNWDVGNVTDISDMFRVASVFNQAIGNWDVSSVTNMRDMFFDAVVFNQAIGSWDVSSVTNMLELFRNAVAFNQDIGSWDVSNTINMYGVFLNTSFNQDIGNWDVSSATTTGNMFGGTTACNQDIGGWNVSNVTEMSAMFLDAQAFNQDIGGWDVGNVTRMQSMFYRATPFDQDIGGWNTGSVTTMSSMFSGATSFDQNLGAWDVRNVIYTSNMFRDATLSTPNYDALLIGWDAQNLQLNNNFHGGNSQYCNGELARANMIGSDSWTINDAGLLCPINPFITTWKTDNTTWNPTTVNITTDPTETYNYTIDWGDGNVDIGVTGDTTHIYAVPGTYTVEISGIFPRFLTNLVYDRLKILSVEQWGDVQWSSMESAFSGCRFLEVNATDIPELSNVTSLRSMFTGCRIMTGNNAISNWDVSGILDMGAMFSYCHLFNQDIGVWNVSNTTDMNNMFLEADLFNQNIGNWDVSNVTLMNSLFGLADNFNQDISNWDVSQVTDMSGMFAATPFNQDIGSWDVRMVTDFNNMFYAADFFNQDIGAWDTSNATTTEGMFRDASSFDQDLGNWDVNALINASNMFQNVTLSTANYDALLIGWNAQNLEPNVTFSGGNSQYCAGEVARTNMISSDGWAITDGGPASPTVNDLVDQNHVESYVLPAITGISLTGGEGYYTATNGGGAFFNSGATIDFGDFSSYPVTIFIYDGSSSCSSEENFQLTLTSSCTPPIADSPLDVDTCESYTIPDLSADYYYYTGTSASGTQLNAGDVISSSQTIYVYSGAPGCSDENSFLIIIDFIVTVDTIDDVTECESYVLPSLTNGDYYTEVGGNGDQLQSGNVITDSQTIYIYFESGTCSDEQRFTVTIDPTVCEVPDPEDTCLVIFPKFFTPNGDGINDGFEPLENPCNLNGTLSIYNRYGKLMFQTNSLDNAWDGGVRGGLLPATDYWYNFIDSENAKVFKGHFSLKR